jgi:hypothetical protein
MIKQNKNLTGTSLNIFRPLMINLQKMLLIYLGSMAKKLPKLHLNSQGVYWYVARKGVILFDDFLSIDGGKRSKR